MIKSKVTGFIDLGNGPVEVQGEAISTPPTLDPEFVEQTRNLRATIKKMQQTVVDVVLGDDGIHRPAGPIVESTLAEKSEDTDG